MFGVLLPVLLLFDSGTTQGYVFVWTIPQPGASQLTPTFSRSDDNTRKRTPSHRLEICLRGNIGSITSLAFR